ncbi:hypothetical protein [Pseudarthrobacter phenanthrenivorans]|uniref:hypothetical protein n=1 Tax=Pseudarthrobacter phenanthrenivorans TaxID=361575 RepID=UPI002F354C8B
MKQGMGNSEACRIVEISRSSGTRWRHGHSVVLKSGDIKRVAPISHQRPVVISARFLSESERITVADLLQGHRMAPFEGLSFASVSGLVVDDELCLHNDSLTSVDGRWRRIRPITGVDKWMLLLDAVEPAGARTASVAAAAAEVSWFLVQELRAQRCGSDVDSRSHDRQRRSW